MDMGNKLSGTTMVDGPLDDTPLVAAEAAWVEQKRRPRQGAWTLTIRQCPYCSRRHTHGGGDGPEPEDGTHRVPHCVKPLNSPVRGYVIVVRPATAPVPDQQKGKP